jgi:hypothetical protein
MRNMYVLPALGHQPLTAPFVKLASVQKLCGRQTALLMFESTSDILRLLHVRCAIAECAVCRALTL